MNDGWSVQSVAIPKLSWTSATLSYTTLGFSLHPLARCDPANTTAKLGEKLVIHVDGVVYVVPSSLPKSSTPFIQYTTSAILENVIRLSLVMVDPINTSVAVHASSIDTNLVPGVVTTPFPVSASIQSAAPAPLMSVQTVHVLVSNTDMSQPV